MALPQMLATVEELEDRVNVDFTTEEVAVARFFLRKASAEARHHGAPWPDPILAPEVVRVIVIEAAARGWMNPEGYELERGDEATFQRQDDFARGSILTNVERETVRQAAGVGGLQSLKTRREVRFVREG